MIGERFPGPPPPERPRLVWLSEAPWRGLRQRHHHLVEHLASDWDVLYVAPPAAGRPPSPRLARAGAVHVAQAAPFLNTTVAGIRAALASPAATAVAAGLATAQVRWALTARGWDAHTVDVVVCSNVYFADAFARIPARARLADICDDPRQFPSAPPWTGGLLDRVLAAADVIVTPSLALTAEFRERGFAVRHVPNGVPAAWLSARRHPAPPPVAAYVGHLAPWLDFPLLLHLAEQQPPMGLVLAGPVAPEVAGQVRRLEALPGVRILPPVPHHAVPGLLRGAAVGLVPFQCTPLTRAVNPVKLYEYAALDLSIVSTAFSPDVLAFGPAVDVCPSPEAFVATVRARVDGVGRRPTRWIAEQHTWSAIGAAFGRLIEAAAGRATGGDG
jgi:glycosyltransferase involved in cell wall biosynthesis